MQCDLHYYATYAMARASGINQEASYKIAYASQYVDDNIDETVLSIDNEFAVCFPPTAHHFMDKRNIEENDQIKVWLPFHFIPGNEGSNMHERLICRKNSMIAQDIVKHNTAVALCRDFGLELMGITAHAYMDTFAHHGFSGIMSHFNRISSISLEVFDVKDDMSLYIGKKARKFLRKYGNEAGIRRNIWDFIISNAAEIPALGHGAVLTYPDRPYLNWAFEYEHEDSYIIRNNPIDYMEALEKVYKIFREFAKQSKYGTEDIVNFNKIEPFIENIINQQASLDDRIKEWQKFAVSGKLTGKPEFIPLYNCALWHKQREDIVEGNIYNSTLLMFLQASSVHRNYMICELLPQVYAANN